MRSPKQAVVGTSEDQRRHADAQQLAVDHPKPGVGAGSRRCPLDPPMPAPVRGRRRQHQGSAEAAGGVRSISESARPEG